jgi:hypothetical protein
MACRTLSAPKYWSHPVKMKGSTKNCMKSGRGGTGCNPLPAGPPDSSPRKQLTLQLFHQDPRVPHGNLGSVPGTSPCLSARSCHHEKVTKRACQLGIGQDTCHCHYYEMLLWYIHLVRPSREGTEPPNPSGDICPWAHPTAVCIVWKRKIKPIKI